MFLSKLYIRHLRNWQEALFTFSPQMNIFWGKNAQGKTSILEAIYLLMTGRSFRTPQQKDIVQEGKDHVYVEACYSREGIEQKLRYTFDGKQRRLFHNATEYASNTQWVGLLPGIIMTPDDRLVKGTPEERRRFLDLQIAQTDPLYIHYLSRYGQAMKHRNALLRTQQLKGIETWEHEMAQAAAYLLHKRHLVIQELEALTRQILPSLILSHEPLSLQYGTKGKSLTSIEALKEELKIQFQQGRPREIAVGTTLTGPHREEMKIFLQQKEARQFASEGQKHTIAIALRLAAWQRLQKLLPFRPLLLVDDLGTGLDKERQKNFVNHLKNLGQVFVTCTAPIAEASTQFEIEGGTLLLR